MRKYNIKNIAVATLFGGASLALTASNAYGATYGQFREMYTKEEFQKIKEEKEKKAEEILKNFWLKKLEERPYSVGEIFSFKIPEGLGVSKVTVIDLASIIFYGGVTGVFGNEERIINRIDEKGTSYFGLAEKLGQGGAYEQFSKMYTREEYQKVGKERLERDKVAIRSIWLEKLREKPLTINGLIKEIPEDLAWVQTKVGIEGIINRYEGIVKRYDESGKLYYGLKEAR